MYSSRKLLVFLIFSMSSVFLLSGCSGSFSGGFSNFGSFSNMLDGPGTNSDNLPLDNVGGEGVVVNWLENMPPDEVKEKQLFQIGVQLNNQGYHDIIDGKLLIYGCNLLDLYDPVNGFDGKGEDKYLESFDLNKRDINNPVGGLSQTFVKGKGLDFSEKCYIRAQTCYDYETHFSTQVCVDTSDVSTSVGKPCEVKSPINPKAQGAPIVVDEIKYYISNLGPESDPSVEYTFDIYVSNVGSGRAIEDTYWDKPCVDPKDASNSGFKERENFVKIQAFLGNVQIDCEPDIQKISFLEKSETRPFFRCTVWIDKDRGTFASILRATLHYGYIQANDFPIKFTGVKDNEFSANKECPVSYCKPAEDCQFYGGYDSFKLCNSPSTTCCKKNVSACEEVNGHCIDGVNCGIDTVIYGELCPGGKICCTGPGPNTGTGQNNGGTNSYSNTDNWNSATSLCSNNEAYTLTQDMIDNELISAANANNIPLIVFMSIAEHESYVIQQPGEQMTGRNQYEIKNGQWVPIQRNAGGGTFDWGIMQINDGYPRDGDFRCNYVDNIANGAEILTYFKSKSYNGVAFTWLKGLVGYNDGYDAAKVATQSHPYIQGILDACKRIAGTNFGGVSWTEADCTACIINNNC